MFKCAESDYSMALKYENFRPISAPDRSARVPPYTVQRKQLYTYTEKEREAAADMKLTK